MSFLQFKPLYLETLLPEACLYQEPVSAWREDEAHGCGYFKFGPLAGPSRLPFSSWCLKGNPLLGLPDADRLWVRALSTTSCPA